MSSTIQSFILLLFLSHYWLLMVLIFICYSLLSSSSIYLLSSTNISLTQFFFLCFLFSQYFFIKINPSCSLLNLSIYMLSSSIIFSDWQSLCFSFFYYSMRSIFILNLIFNCLSASNFRTIFGGFFLFILMFNGLSASNCRTIFGIYLLNFLFGDVNNFLVFLNLSSLS